MGATVTKVYSPYFFAIPPIFPNKHWLSPYFTCALVGRSGSFAIQGEGVEGLKTLGCILLKLCAEVLYSTCVVFFVLIFVPKYMTAKPVYRAWHVHVRDILP